MARRDDLLAAMASVLAADDPAVSQDPVMMELAGMLALWLGVRVAGPLRRNRAARGFAPPVRAAR